MPTISNWIHPITIKTTSQCGLDLSRPDRDPVTSVNRALILHIISLLASILGLHLLSVVLPREDSNGTVSRDVPSCYPYAEEPQKNSGLVSRLHLCSMTEK